MVALGRALRMSLTALLTSLGVMLSSRMESASAGDGLLEFGGGADFDLDDLAGLAACESAVEDGGQAAAERDVVVLDEDSVLQVEAVVDAAAAADGVLIERAQAGDGLAGVEDFGFGFCGATAWTNSLVRVAMPDMRCIRLRMTRSVERMAGGVGADDGDGLAFADVDAVEDLGVGDDFEAAGAALELCRRGRGRRRCSRCRRRRSPAWR